MSAPKRKREVQLNFRVSPEELALIEQKMAQLGQRTGKPICARWPWTAMWCVWNCRS